jgi:hypothetical protein
MGSFAALNGTLTYDTAAKRYVYSWQTIRTSKGTCREFALTLNDGTSHSERIKLTS